MNRYLMIRRLRWPVLLLLTGVLALLQQMGVVRFWHMWPLYLICWGVLLLAERAAINEMDMQAFPGSGFGPMGVGPIGPIGPVGIDPMGAPVAPYAAQSPAPAPVPTVETEIVPAHDTHGDEITHRGANGSTNGDTHTNGGINGGGEL